MTSESSSTPSSTPSSTLSTHVLDAALGLPATGLDLALYAGATGDDLLGRASTDADGRVRFDEPVSAGPHRLVLATGPWFAAAGRTTFFPEVAIVFDVDPGQRHHHVALLLSPFSYTTYRGS